MSEKRSIMDSIKQDIAKSGGNFKGYLLKHAGSIDTSDGQKDAAYVTGRRCEPSG